MHLIQLQAAAALAGLAQAFLLPPSASTSAADDEIIKTLPFEEGIAAEGRTTIVDCPGCPIATTDVEGKVHYSEGKNALRLDFSIAHNGADQLLLNGLQLYPIDPRSQTFMEPLVAEQVVKQDNNWALAGTPRLGYSLKVSHPVESTQDQMDLVSIHIEIVEVANKFLDSVPAIDVKLLRTASGKLMLGDVEILSPVVAEQPTDGGQECTTIVCKWRAIIANRISALKKGCKGKPTLAQVDGPKTHRPQGHPRPHGRPHGAHRPHGHHRNRHGFARFFRNIAVHVFIPIFIGILVGITASLIGMLVGNLVIFIWRALFRRGDQTQYIRVQEIVIEDGEDIDDETKSFLEHQGPPPTYTSGDEKTPQ